jgi:hypothetical protein
MRFVKVPTELLVDNPDLQELMWPDGSQPRIDPHTYTAYIPTNHPNLTYILLMLPKIEWVDLPTGSRRRPTLII